MKLSVTQIEERLTQLNNWLRVSEKEIECKYQFLSFTAAMEFVNKIANFAEEIGHHPLISIDYREVVLRLTTWTAGGLTGLDFQSAQSYDEIFAKQTQASTSL